MKTVREHLIEIFGIEGSPSDTDILDAVEAAVLSETHFALLVAKRQEARLLLPRTVSAE
jgi:hypothetical protein